MGRGVLNIDSGTLKNVILAAIIPASMHFLGVLTMVHFEAKRLDSGLRDEEIPKLDRHCQTLVNHYTFPKNLYDFFRINTLLGSILAISAALAMALLSIYWVGCSY